MNILFFGLNIVGLTLFIVLMPRICGFLEMINTKRKPIRVNSDIPVTVINIWKYFKKFILVFIFMIFPIVNINIPSSGSMTPTFRTWDIIFSSHVIYGLSPENIGIESIRNLIKPYWQNPVCVFTEPEVGDDIVFRVPNSEIPYSKRIVAKEGDELWFRGNVLTLNGQVCPIKYMYSKELSENKFKFKVNVYEITMPTCTHLFALDDGIELGDVAEHQYMKVPKDMFVCIGDYLTNSADARTLIGYVDRNSIFAKLQWIISRNPDIRFLNPIQILSETEFGIKDI
jgi:signal peptidase I